MRMSMTAAAAALWLGAGTAQAASLGLTTLSDPQVVDQGLAIGAPEDPVFPLPRRSISTDMRDC